MQKQIAVAAAEPKRLSAWLTKNPHVFSKSSLALSSNIADVPAGNIEEHISLTNGENSELPGASSVLMLRENDEKGRYVVARDVINPGDTLFIEKPFTLVLCETEHSHCDFCCLPLPEEPARCLNCQRVSYCSSFCHREAMLRFHKYECGFNLGQHTSVMLAMDQIRTRDIHGAEVKQAMIHNFGGRILHHLAQMVCNGNAITAYAMDSAREDNSLVQERQLRVATAIFPSASMMNHSCDPNILTSYVGNTLIARAAKKINPGEEVFNCYGPHYASIKTAQRKQQLQQQYFFICQCQPCSAPQDFLDIEGIDGLLCPECKGSMKTEEKKCLTCQHELTKEQLYKLRDQQKMCADILYEGEQLLVTENLADAEKCVLRALAIQSNILYPHNCKLAETRDFLAILLAKQGKYARALEQLQLSLASAEKCYGSKSVEVSGILDTIVDVAAEDLANLQQSDWKQRWECARNWCDRGIKIVDMLLGPWHSRMLSFLASQRQLQSLKEKFDARYWNESLPSRL
ncbi:UNVERIFIED_CONTAM: hypothetical protein B566_EDAN015875 [Ephemera danica]|nr:hypothetical protein B566_EDAN015875 [Ephemera danica]